MGHLPENKSGMTRRERPYAALDAQTERGLADEKVGKVKPLDEVAARPKAEYAV
jgi:hypothetical protein